MSSPRLGTFRVIVVVLLLAPICAEYSSSYLQSTGAPGELLFGLVFFAPLYGGAALLIHEVALRRGGGWATRLLLAAAFGLSMTGLIDLSAFTRVRDDVNGWSQLVAPTWIETMGLSLGAAISWTLGHVLLSIASPLAVVEALSPATRERPWLRGRGLLLTTIGLVTVAALIHLDQRGAYGADPHWWQSGAVLLVVLLLIGLGLWAPWLPPSGPAGPPDAADAMDAAEAPGAPGLVMTGAMVMVVADIAFLNHLVLAGAVTLVLLAAWSLARRAGRTAWGAREPALLAIGALAGRAAMAFVGPLPPGVELAAKLAQNTVFAGLVLVLGWAVVSHHRKEERTRPLHR